MGSGRGSAPHGGADPGLAPRPAPALDHVPGQTVTRTEGGQVVVEGTGPRRTDRLFPAAFVALHGHLLAGGGIDGVEPVFFGLDGPTDVLDRLALEGSTTPDDADADDVVMPTAGVRSTQTTLYLAMRSPSSTPGAGAPGPGAMVRRRPGGRKTGGRSPGPLLRPTGRRERPGGRIRWRDRRSVGRWRCGKRRRCRST